jgi:hypothetical protein
VREVKILLKHQSKNNPLIYNDILADEQGVIEVEEMKIDNRKLFFQNLSKFSVKHK